MTCIFCQIISGEASGAILHRDDLVTAFRDIHPKAPQHILVVPREHLVSLNELEQRQGGEGHALLQFIVRVAKQVGIDESGYRALTNVGPDGGQEVQHLHFHILGGEDLGDFR